MSIAANTHAQSLLKAFSWRILATLTTIIISYIVTHELKYALSIGFIEVFAKVALYYVHERFWLIC